MFDSLEGLISGVPADQRLENISTVGSVGAIIFNVLMATTFSVSLITMAFGAFRYVVSSGDPKLIEKAYHTMFWSGLAALVALISIAIKRAVVQLTGITAPDIVGDQPGF